MSNQEQIDKLIREAKVRLGASKIHGVGVFAMRDINKGDRVYADQMPTFYTLPYANFGKLLKEIEDIILEQWPQIANGSAFAWPTARYVAFMNHSDDPNYDGFKDVALKDIKKGEEITEDYRQIAGSDVVHTWLDKITSKDVVE